MKKVLVSQLTLVLSLAASAASAQAVKQNNNQLVGSDTLIDVVNNAITLINTDANPSNNVTALTYDGIGSSAGQRQLEGNVNRSGEPTCLGPTGAVNPGCQQIAPMSRPLNNGICDDLTAGPEANNLAEQLSVCGDALAILVSNASYQAGAIAGQSCTTLTSTPTTIDASPASPTYGELITALGSNELGGNAVLPSGYQIGGNGMPAWKDVLRLVYTGCENNQDCTTAGGLGGRKDRCGTGTPARAELISNWFAMFNESTVCASGHCPAGLRAAYRRDDNSGTTNTFLEFLSVFSQVTTARATYRTTLGSACAVAINDTHSFCDGGQFEGFWNNALTGAVDHPDPVTAACDNADDLCAADGRLSVVRAIRSVDQQSYTTDEAFPPRQCTRNVFRLVATDNTSCKVCPDGTAPLGGSCFMPVDTSQGFDNFNCINSRVSRPAGFSGDGRVYNWGVRNAATGATKFLATAAPDVAQWRQNYANVSTGAGVGLAGGSVGALLCAERQATSQISCIVGKSNCVIGFSGIEAATNPDYDDTHEPLLLAGVEPFAPVGNYPMGRKLWINSIGGFENTSAQCATDMVQPNGNNAPFCQSQVNLVNWLADQTINAATGRTNAADACLASGFAPLAAQSCVGAAAAAPAGAGCGAPEVQSLSACQAL